MSFKTKIKEHCADIKNQSSCFYAIVEHTLITKHHICLEDTSIIAKEEHYFKRIFREANEILKHPNNLHHTNGLKINRN